MLGTYVIVYYTTDYLVIKSNLFFSVFSNK